MEVVLIVAEPAAADELVPLPEVVPLPVELGEELEQAEASSPIAAIPASPMSLERIVISPLSCYFLSSFDHVSGGPTVQNSSRPECFFEPVVRVVFLAEGRHLAISGRPVQPDRFGEGLVGL